MATAARKARKIEARKARELLGTIASLGHSPRTNLYKSAKADVDATRYVSPKAGRVRKTNRNRYDMGDIAGLTPEQNDYMRTLVASEPKGPVVY